MLPVKGDDILNCDAEDVHLAEDLFQFLGDERSALSLPDDASRPRADEVPDAALVVDDAVLGQLVV